MRSWTEEERRRRFRECSAECGEAPLPAGASVVARVVCERVGGGSGAVESRAGVVSGSGALAGGPAEAMGEVSVRSWVSSSRTGGSGADGEATRLLCALSPGTGHLSPTARCGGGSCLGVLALAVVERSLNAWQCGWLVVVGWRGPRWRAVRSRFSADRDVCSGSLPLSNGSS